MFRRIREMWHKIWDTLRIASRNGAVPKAAPSVEEAILPYDPEEWTIHPYELKYMIDSGRDFVLLDVREEWEYQLVHIDRAVSIPLGELLKRFSELSPIDEIVVYCHHGMRSLDAAFGTAPLREAMRRVSQILCHISLIRLNISCSHPRCKFLKYYCHPQRWNDRKERFFFNSTINNRICFLIPHFTESVLVHIGMVI